jgi:hypothetical protein
MTNTSMITFRSSAAILTVVGSSLFGSLSGNVMSKCDHCLSGMSHNMTGSKTSVTNAIMNCMPIIVVNASDLPNKFLFNDP